MAVPWGLVVLLVGIVYGYAKPGKQSKWRIFKTGLLVGLVLGLVSAILGSLAGLRAIGIGGGFWGIVIDVVVLTVLFIVGVWIGDVLE